jgi:hypothetical protein
MNKMFDQYDLETPQNASGVVDPRKNHWEMAYLLSGADLDGKIEVDYGFLQTAQLLIIR